MTNPTYTDDQIETAIAGTTFPNRLGEMLAYVYADRQRLRVEVKEQAEQMEAEAIVMSAYFDRINELEAEVEALRKGATRLANNWVRHATSGASRSPWVHDDCAEQLRDLLEETRANPNETKEAKS